jgi:Argininosuccinate lyase
LAHVEFLIRIYERLREVYKRLDYCVLGSGAIAGVNWPINRKLTAQLLGFRNITQNAMDSINSRGEIESELIFILSLLSIHLSRISEDLIIYSTQEFNLVEIPDESIGISSIMPQKEIQILLN